MLNPCQMMAVNSQKHTFFKTHICEIAEVNGCEKGSVLLKGINA